MRLFESSREIEQFVGLRLRSLIGEEAEHVTSVVGLSTTQKFWRASNALCVLGLSLFLPSQTTFDRANGTGVIETQRALSVYQSKHTFIMASSGACANVLNVPELFEMGMNRLS